MHRRSLLQGLIALLVSLAMPRAVPAFDERELLRPFDPKVKGVRWQSWPWGTARPDEFASGTIIPVEANPLSHYTARLDRHRAIWPDLDFEPII